MITMNLNGKWYTETEAAAALKYQAEQIRQLKKILLQACSDFDDLSNRGAIECRHFLYNVRTCDGCPLNSDDDECKWIYETEALALIGEDFEKK